MPYTLLQLIQQVADEIGITRPNAVIGSNDQQVRQLAALANKVGKDLVRDYEWRRIVKENIFETTSSRGGTALVSSANTLTGLTSASSLCATGDIVVGNGIPQWAEAVIVTETQITLNVRCIGSASQTASCSFQTQYYPLPSDFDRQISRTQWDRSDHWGMSGPKSSQEWQWLKGGIISAGPVYRYRIFGNRFKVHPAPTSRLILANEYVSNQWIAVSSSSDPTLSAYAADTNVAIFPDDVMVNGIKFQWYKTKGLDFNVPLAEFNRSLSYAKAQDQPAPMLNLAPEPQNILIGINNAPDGNFPGPS
jgi:hypothetical protein